MNQYASDTERLRSELKKLVASLHPDRNGGSFLSEDQEAKFLRTKSAMDFLETYSQSSMAMIPVSQLPAVVSAVAQALALQNPNEVTSLQTSYLIDARERIARHSVLPKIGSGVFAAITGFLVGFPDKFAKHPLLGPLLERRWAQAFLLILLGYSAIVFALAWYKERVLESCAEYLMSESALREVFERLIFEVRGSESVTRVSSRQIFNATMRLAYRRSFGPFSPLKLFLGRSLDLATIEKAAAIQTQRLVDRKILSKVDVPSLDTWYEIRPSA